MSDSGSILWFRLDMIVYAKPSKSTLRLHWCMTTAVTAAAAAVYVLASSIRGVDDIAVSTSAVGGHSVCGLRS